MNPIGITDAMTAHAVGASPDQFLGKTIDLVYEIPDSDRAEFLLRFTDGTSFLVSCDPGYDQELLRRTPESWETCIYDATDTDAGRALARRRVA